jgi:hypothetical protein
VPRLLTLLVLVAAGIPTTAQNPREKKVRDDKQKVEADGYWIYNDLPRAFAEARQSGKPMVVVLRCIPCAECVKLDDDLVNSDPVIRPLLDKFVRIRVISTNGLDLSMFQYDTDQSFAVFFLNADGTVYGRFGTRSHRTNWVGDVSFAGLAKALRGALDLHAGYPGNKAALADKRGPAPEFPTPEQFPALKPRYTDKLNYAGNVVQSCIHCHQIGEARRMFYRTKGGPMPEEILFPYPHPKVIGLVLDPTARASVKEVETGSFADKIGFRAGDEITTLAGQPLLSIADVQWVLHLTPADGGTVPAVVKRGGATRELTLTLPKGWRRLDTLSWRASSWSLRRMSSGGMLLEETDTGLRVKYVGQNGPHAAAKNAGIQVGDLIADFDGIANPKRETDILAHGVTARKPGDKVPVTVLRDGKKIALTLQIQE